MKFTTQLLSILAAISVYAHVDLIQTKQCANDLDESYLDCYTFEDLTKESLQTVCQAYNSEKCQKLYKEGVAIAGDCKLLDLESVTEMNKEYGTKFIQMELLCTTDENNQYCPITNYYIVDENETLSAREAYNKFVNESCKSKKCTDAYIAVTKKELELRKGSDFYPKTTFDSAKIDKAFDGATVDDEDEIAYTIAFLESSFCSSQATTTAASGNSQTSGNGQASGNAQAGNSTGNAAAGNAQQGGNNNTSDATTVKSFFTIFIALFVLYHLF